MAPFLMTGIYHIIPINIQNTFIIKLISSFLPSVSTVEGGFTFVLICLIFLLFREREGLRDLLFAGVAMLMLMESIILNSDMFVSGYQWMMIFSIPIYRLYNGKRGNSSRLFFYLFYPSHLFLLYILSTLLSF